MDILSLKVVSLTKELEGNKSKLSKMEKESHVRVDRQFEGGDLILFERIDGLKSIEYRGIISDTDFPIWLNRSQMGSVKEFLKGETPRFIIGEVVLKETIVLNAPKYGLKKGSYVIEVLAYNLRPFKFKEPLKKEAKEEKKEEFNRVQVDGISACKNKDLGSLRRVKR